MPKRNLLSAAIVVLMIFASVFVAASASATTTEVADATAEVDELHHVEDAVQEENEEEDKEDEEEDSEEEESEKTTKQVEADVPTDAATATAMSVVESSSLVQQQQQLQRTGKGRLGKHRILVANQKLTQQQKIDFVTTATNLWHYTSIAKTCFDCYNCKWAVQKAVAMAQSYLHSYGATVTAACHTYVGVPVGAGCLSIMASLSAAVPPAAPAIAIIAPACPIAGGVAGNMCDNTITNWVKEATAAAAKKLSLPAPSQRAWMTKMCTSVCHTTASFNAAWNSYSVNKGKPAPALGCDALYPSWIVKADN